MWLGLSGKRKRREGEVRKDGMMGGDGVKRFGWILEV